MFKVAAVDPQSFKEAEDIMQRIYNENPAYWPYGLKVGSFDSGVYLVRHERTNVPVGFCGFQLRDEWEKQASGKFGKVRTGYYSIGTLKEFRGNGFAKSAVESLIAFKAASCDRVRALIMAGNKPSLALAASLGVPTIIKQASTRVFSCVSALRSLKQRNIA